jgi:hypothetical protein
VNISPKFSLLPEGGDQLGASAHVLQGFPAKSAQFGQVSGAEIRQTVLLEITPDVFGRIEFGRVRLYMANCSSSRDR